MRKKESLTNGGKRQVAISPFLMELQVFGMPNEDCWVDAQLPKLNIPVEWYPAMQMRLEMSKYATCLIKL